MSMTVEDVNAPHAHRDPKPTPNIPSNVLDQFLLKGRVAIITGAADGIGLAVAEAYAEAGANLALWYNTNTAAIEHAERLAKQHGVKAKAWQEVLAEFGRVDIMVANAGMAISKGILETSVEEYRKQMAVNVDGVVYCAKYVGEVFRSQGRGNLIITSSISAHIVNVPIDQPVLQRDESVCNTLREEFGEGVEEFARVNVVSPGFFDTKMGAGDMVKNEGFRMACLGRQGDTREIKGLYLYLASDASTFVTGTDVVIDGGYILP